MNIGLLRLAWDVFSLIGFGFVVGYIMGQLRSHKNSWSIEELEEILKQKKSELREGNYEKDKSTS